MTRSILTIPLRLAGGFAAGILALILLITTVSWLVSECVRDIRKSASHPTSPPAVR